MSRRTEVDGMSKREMREMMQETMRQATQPLQEEVRELKKKLHEQRPVITHKEAPAYFNHEVKPETITGYIRNEGLPATKRGRLWFIRVDELQEWQAGRVDN